MKRAFFIIAIALAATGTTITVQPVSDTVYNTDDGLVFTCAATGTGTVRVRGYVNGAAGMEATNSVTVASYPDESHPIDTIWFRARDAADTVWSDTVFGYYIAPAIGKLQSTKMLKIFGF